MDEDVADQKWSASAAIVAICMIGIAAPAVAEPISGQIVEQAIGNSAAPVKGVEEGENPASAFSGADNDKYNPTDSERGQAPLPRDRQSASSPSIRQEQPVVSPGSLAGQAPGSPAAATSEDERWNLNRELKEAVRPLYEDLKAAGVVDAVQSLKADLGLSSSSPSDPRTASDNPRSQGNSAPQDRQRSAAQIERDKLIAAAMWDEFIEDVKPWLYGLAGLFVLGYMIKLAVGYAEWKAMRSIKQGSRATRHHRHAKVGRHQDGAGGHRARTDGYTEPAAHPAGEREK